MCSSDLDDFLIQDMDKQHSLEICTRSPSPLPRTRKKSEDEDSTQTQTPSGVKAQSTSEFLTWPCLIKRGRWDFCPYSCAFHYDNRRLVGRGVRLDPKFIGTACLEMKIHVFVPLRLRLCCGRRKLRLLNYGLLSIAHFVWPM